MSEEQELRDKLTSLTKDERKKLWNETKEAMVLALDTPNSTFIYTVAEKLGCFNNFNRKMVEKVEYQKGLDLQV